MTWVRLDDEFPEHPKVLKVGGFGMAMQLAGLAYCNRNLTDGFLPRGIVPGLVSWELIDPDGKVWEGAITCGKAGDDIDNRWIAENLVRVGIWHDQNTVHDCDRCLSLWPASQSHGYFIHDFPVYQPLRESVEREREKTKERVKRFRKRHSNGVTNAGSNGRETLPPVPVPVPVPVLPSIDDELKGNALDVGPFLGELKDIDEGMERVIRGIGKELPEAAFHTALESLRERRQRQPELDSETRYFIGTLASMKREGQYA